MSGYLGDLSSSQEEALIELRKNLSDVLTPKHDDHHLLQFLRARRFDLIKTEEMFRRHIQFRKDYPEEYMVNEYKPPEFLIKHLLPPLLGYDKGGCPVRIVHVGHQDIRGLANSVRRPEMRKCVTWFLDTDKEDMRKRSKETGIHIESRTFIFDLEDLSFRQIYHKDMYEMVISFLRLYECNYPENLKVAYIINTPSFFWWLFNMVKSLLSEDTVQKLKIYGNTGWKEDLVANIDADILPVIYGGTRTDPDGNPNCPSLVRVYNPIPKEYYFRNQNRLNAKDENVFQVSVHRRSKYRIPILVEVPGSLVTWEIDCKNCDIKAYLQYSDSPNPQTMVESTLISSDNGSEKGCVIADKTGKYSLVLDNSYSFFRSKTILYQVNVNNYNSNNSDGNIPNNVSS